MGMCNRLSSRKSFYIHGQNRMRYLLPVIFPGHKILQNSQEHLMSNQAHFNFPFV